MPGSKVGYIRVSTPDQKLLRQLDGVELDKVFEDMVSGSTINREGWNRCNDYLREGDELHVHSIDRLARNLGDLQRIVSNLTDRSITVHFHRENLVFGGGKADPIQTLLFHLLGAFAQFERELIKERQREGLIAAKRKGKPLGRPSKLTEEQEKEILEACSRGENTKKLAEKYGVSRQTIYERIWKQRDKKINAL